MAALAEAMQSACDAALAGDLETVRARLREAEHLEGYSINAKGTRSRTPLYQSCLGRNPEVALWLLEQGAQDEPQGCGYVAICATGKGSEDSADAGERTAAIMRRFGFAGKPKKVKKKKTKQSTAPTERTNEGKGKSKKQNNGKGAKRQHSTAQLLELAVAAARAGDTSPLLQKGASGKNAELPIHHATRTRNADALAILLATDCAKEQLLSAGKGGRLPVHYAVQTKDVESLQLMVRVGGTEQLLQPDSSGRIPLQCALSGSSTEVSLALLAAGGTEQCLIAGKNGDLPVHHAATVGDEQLLSALLSCGSAEQQSLSADKDGRLPVHHALRRALHTGGATRVPSIKRCVGTLVDAGGTSQLGVRDSDSALALDYVLSALAEAEASSRAELEQAERENSLWVQDLQSNHKEALQALEQAHAAALADAKHLATADTALKLQEAEGKQRQAEERAATAEERIKQVEVEMSTASRQYEEELECQRAALAKAQAQAYQALAGLHHGPREVGAPRDSVESLPLSPPRGPSSLRNSWDGPLVQQNVKLPLARAASARLAADNEQVGGRGESSRTSGSSDSTLNAYVPRKDQYRPTTHACVDGGGGSSGHYDHDRGCSVSSTGDHISKIEAESRAVVDIAGRVNALAQELSAMLAAPSG